MTCSNLYSNNAYPFLLNYSHRPTIKKKKTITVTSYKENKKKYIHTFPMKVVGRYCFKFLHRF